MAYVGSELIRARKLDSGVPPRSTRVKASPDHPINFLTAVPAAHRDTNFLCEHSCRSHPLSRQGDALPLGKGSGDARFAAFLNPKLKKERKTMSLSEIIKDNQTACFKQYGVFFAFSNKQLNEQKKQTLNTLVLVPALSALKAT